jgi:hypothetical protein
MIRTPLTSIVIEWPWKMFGSCPRPLLLAQSLVDFVGLGGPGLADVIGVIIPSVGAKACISLQDLDGTQRLGMAQRSHPVLFSPTGRKEGPTDERVQGRPT